MDIIKNIELEVEAIENEIDKLVRAERDCIDHVNRISHRDVRSKDGESSEASKVIREVEARRRENVKRRRELTAKLSKTKGMLRKARMAFKSDSEARMAFKKVVAGNVEETTSASESSEA